jgi:hypothetical protein
MTTARTRRIAVSGVVALTILGLAGLPAAAAAGAHRHHHSVLYVGQGKNGHGDPATAGADRHHGSCNEPDYRTITAAVRAASAGGTVVVCRGTYREDVLIAKHLHLVGRHATIDAKGLENGIQVVTSWVSISRLTVRNANGEGILVGVDTMADASLLTSRVLTHVRIDRVKALKNDRGFNGTEHGNCKYPGDCGGGVHLNVTAWSSVTRSIVNGNADGILLTDDYGPASHNLIAGNVVNRNKTECGIVLPSHNNKAVSYDTTTKPYVVTGRNPSAGGIYDNVVRDNVAIANGTAKAPPQFGGGGSGSGLGLFGSGPGTGVYDNLVTHNFASGNGLAGFTIHAHLPGGEDLNGNKVTKNVFGTNNIGGDPYDGPPGPTDFQTTGIAVYSAPKVHMTISRNTIFDNKIGIWLSTTVTAHGLTTNHFHDVTKPVVRG